MLTTITSVPLLAYLGPGGVLSAFGSLLALGAAILLALVGFLWYPLKRFLRARRERTQDQASA